MQKLVDDCEREHYHSLLEEVGWFFFDFLLLRYVEDRNSGLSFHLPGGLFWFLYAEVLPLSSCGLDLFATYIRQVLFFNFA